MSFIGDYPEDFTTVCVYFTTHDGTGAPVAPLTGYEAADVSIYKNGSATQKTSTNGVTMTSPFDSVTGLHCVVIDTSNDTGDSGFWTTGGGGVYTVILNPDTETVNGQVTVKALATFTIKSATSAPSAAQIAAAVWQDTTAGDFTTALSVGKSLMNGVTLGTGLTVNAVTGLTASNLDTTISSRLASGSYTAPSNLTAAQIATGVWQDATANDFVTSGSIGKSLFTSGILPGAAGGLFIAGTNAATTITTSLTTTFTGNLTGNVGGNVTGSIGSLATQAKADVNAEADTALADYDAPTHTELTAELATADDATLTAIAALNNLSQTNVRSAVGLASANLDTQLGAIAGYIDTEIGTLQTTATAIKLKTDSLAFTVAAKLDVNVLYVNGIQVKGSGTSGDPWNPV